MLSYTPDENWIKYKKIPPQFVNVVEDARIEKLMKRKYAGLLRLSIVGTKNSTMKISSLYLMSDVTNSMNLADRANLYFQDW